ncbi:hypothetical protein V8F20_012444 [Naviculisporaceae sp. PSN 640]
MHAFTFLLLLITNAVAVAATEDPVDDGALPTKTSAALPSSLDTILPTVTTTKTKKSKKTTVAFMDGRCPPPICQKKGCKHSQCSYYCAVCFDKLKPRVAGPAETYQTPAPEKK